MSTWIKVARSHLVDQKTYIVLPWIILAASFLVIIALDGGAARHPLAQAYNLVVIYLEFFVVGILSIVRWLPFTLGLGVSRRGYYAGMTLLAVGLAAADGLALTVLQVIERATGGWGIALHFFRVPYILAGPWYLTWLTGFVGLSLMFGYGTWFGLVYKRWNLAGLLTFIAAQVTAGYAAWLALTRAHAWPAIGRFLTTISATGLTGLLAALAVTLAAGGYITAMRRLTV